MTRRMARRAMVLGPVFMALALAVQPVAASTPISQSGLYGEYQINDDQGTTRGANCLYEGHKTNGKYLLNKISIRPPVVHAHDYGAGNTSQWVGWRYVIQRDSNFDNVYGDVYKSGWVKDKASETEIADFTRRTWTAPENPAGNYRVRIIIKWFKPGTTSTQSGRAVEELDWYHLKVGDNASGKIRNNVCYKNYQDA